MMDENKCTAGTWTMHPYKPQDNPNSGYIILYVGYKETTTIATVVPVFGMKKETVLANARIITQSKRLLQDCIALVHALTIDGVATANLALIQRANETIKDAT